MEEFLIHAELAELQSILRENGINDLEILGELIAHPDDMKVIIKNVGARLKLEKKYREYTHASKDIVELSIPVSESGGFVNSLPLQLIQDFIQIPSELSENNTAISTSCETDAAASLQQNTAEPLTKKRKIEQSNFDFSVELALKKHPLGRALFTIGQFYKKLKSQYQSMIVDIIVCELLIIPKHVTNDDLQEVAQQIVILFEKECVETYYIPPVRKRDSRSNKSELSKGKLPDKLRNLRTIIRDAAHLGKEITIYAEKKKYENAEINTAENSKVWLVHNREATEVINHWNSSYLLREIDIDTKKYLNIDDVLKNWPILKESKSFELIEKDFDKKFPDAGNIFILEWDNFFANLLTLYGKKIKDEDSVYVQLLDSKDNQLQADSKTAVQFYLLASLMAPKSNKKRVQKQQKDTDNGRSGFWKPSIAESREGFIFHVKVPGDIENRIYAKKEALIKKGVHLQPLVIVVGDDLTDITKSYVRFESITYELPSLLKSIDILFKIFMVFDLPYPLECENFCYLIQWGVYKIRTKSDKKIPFVYNTLQKLKPEEK